MFHYLSLLFKITSVIKNVTLIKKLIIDYFLIFDFNWLFNLLGASISKYSSKKMYFNEKQTTGSLKYLYLIKDTTNLTL